jgi:methyl coenzyme M reductase beta subunit
MEPEKKQKRKSTGRRKKPAAEVKNVRHTIRFTESENEELQSVIKFLGINIGEFIRSKALGAKNQVVNGANLIASLDKIGGDLGRAGNNINQLAKHANTVNKSGKVDESIMSRFNVLFAEYIKAQQETQTALRKIIREVKG